MADSKKGAQRPAQRRAKSGDGGDYVSAKTLDPPGISSSTQPRTPSAGKSFVYPVRSLLANIEPAHETSGAQETGGEMKSSASGDDVLSLSQKDGGLTAQLGSRVARTPDGAVVFPALPEPIVPFKSTEMKTSDTIGTTEPAEVRQKCIYCNKYRVPLTISPR